MSDLPIPADDFESVLEDYPIKLEHFEGPLDLLLHLIRKNEVDIYDIPILPITKQYLEYLDLMQEFDLDAAGEFRRIAAFLDHRNGDDAGGDHVGDGAAGHGAEQTRCQDRRVRRPAPVIAGQMKGDFY